MENGINNLNLEVIKIDKLISEVLDLYEFSAEEKEIEIVFSPTHLTFKLDKHKVRQAIANIIDNSIKYSPRCPRYCQRQYVGGRVLLR
jgi:signal transduction histidine kinase